MKRVVVCSVVLYLMFGPRSATADPATTFTRRCKSCHTFGQGTLVGPDLKGATDRHTRDWLVSWISSSEMLIRSGDAAAVALFDKFKHQPMPDQNLSPADLSALLDYLAAGGPEADALKKTRRADTATPAEIELGRTLFVGARAFARGGASCVSCHRLGDTTGVGGTLGPDLSHAYARFQDKALAALLARGCFPRAPYTTEQNALTEEESFSLKAFLRHAMGGPR